MGDRNKPSFSNNSMPLDVNTAGLDEGAEETTRKIAFEPSFEPLTNFQPPSMLETTFAGSLKTSTVTAPPPTTASFTWKLAEAPVLPDFHPLEQTAVLVPHASAGIVSARISQVLRERSIEATYDDEKAKVKCLTSEGVDFRVRLYRGRGKHSHGVIVEVQRRFGTSTSFHQETTAILDAAQGQAPPPPPKPLSSKNLPLVEDDEEDSRDAIDGASSLMVVANMLHSGHDAHHLALSILLSMTDSSKMGRSQAKAVAKELFRLDDHNEVASNVLSLVLDKNSDDGVFKLRSLAFQVIANGFEALRGDVPMVMKEQLRSIMIDELRAAGKTPRTAVQAARVMVYYCPQDIGDDLYKALEMALEAGKAKHAALERHAQACLDKFDG